MDDLLMIVIIIFIGIVTIAAITVFAFLNKNGDQKVQIYFVDGADIETGRISHNAGYFKGFTPESDVTVAAGGGYYYGVPIRITNLNTTESIGLVLENNLDIGRQSGPGMYIISNDSMVSKRHCRLTALESVIYVRDLGSANRTYLNGKEVTDIQKCHSGDVLRVGNTELRIDL